MYECVNCYLGASRYCICTWCKTVWMYFTEQIDSAWKNLRNCEGKLSCISIVYIRVYTSNVWIFKSRSNPFLVPQLVLSNGGKVSCSMKQREPLKGIELTTDRLRANLMLYTGLYECFNLYPPIKVFLRCVWRSTELPIGMKRRRVQYVWI